MDELQRPQPLASARALGEPFGDAELADAWNRPTRLIDIVLAAPARIAANIEHGRALGALALVLLGSSIAFAIPYGLVLGFEAWWRVIALYLGTTLICLPSFRARGLAAAEPRGHGIQVTL